MAVPHDQRDKFEPFQHLKSIPYGQVRGHPIPLDVLIPKNIQSSSGARPVIVNIHGGCLIAGSRDFQPFFADWILEEAIKENAILVTPDYPLAPESKTPEILQALDSFVKWLLDGNLQKELDSKVPHLQIRTDVSKLLVVGESAGGWCALHLGLSYPDRIRGLALRFPMLEIDSDYYTNPNGLKQVMGMPVPGPENIDQVLQQLTPESIKTSTGPERFPLAFSALGNARILELLGDSEATFPLRRLKAGARLPKRVWILQGEDDTVVPQSGNDRAVALIKEHIQDTELRYDTRPGEHGLDGAWTSTGEPLVGERLAWLQEVWLA